MGEYQYYEFWAVDKPLTESQQSKISDLSSRAYVTSREASFMYNYSDFRGDPFKLVSQYFDLMLYIANWGGRQLMMRFPRGILEEELVKEYCQFDSVDFTRTKKHVILNFSFSDEDLACWTDGEGWLASLSQLREDLIAGDYRSLYLIWLKGAMEALYMEDVEYDMLEPPIPYDLGKLSKTLESFVDFFGIDERLIDEAAKMSPKSKRKGKKSSLEQYIKELPKSEMVNFLKRLSRDESGLSQLLNKRLMEFAPESNMMQANSTRSIGELLEAADIFEFEEE